MSSTTHEDLLYTVFSILVSVLPFQTEIPFLSSYFPSPSACVFPLIHGSPILGQSGFTLRPAAVIVNCEFAINITPEIRRLCIALAVPPTNLHAIMVVALWTTMP
jgi:hypothetical protein